MHVLDWIGVSVNQFCPAVQSCSGVVCQRCSLHCNLVSSSLPFAVMCHFFAGALCSRHVVLPCISPFLHKQHGLLPRSRTTIRAICLLQGNQTMKHCPKAMYYRVTSQSRSDVLVAFNICFGLPLCSVTSRPASAPHASSLRRLAGLRYPGRQPVRNIHRLLEPVSGTRKERKVNRRRSRYSCRPSRFLTAQLPSQG